MLSLPSPLNCILARIKIYRCLNRIPYFSPRHNKTRHSLRPGKIQTSIISYMYHGTEASYNALEFRIYGREISYEPRFEKTGLRGFRPGLTQTRL